MIAIGKRIIHTYQDLQVVVEICINVSVGLRPDDEKLPSSGDFSLALDHYTLFLKRQKDDAWFLI